MKKNISNKKFSVIVSDVNWCYSNWSDTAHGAAIAHYKTASLEDTKKIPVDRWQDKDCIHFMWCTLPKINEGLELLKAWGLHYVTSIVWLKTVPSNGTLKRGIGFTVMQNAELLVVGRKGHPKQDRTNPQIGIIVGDEEHKLDRVFYAPSRKHSQKPESVQDWIERSFSGPYLELYATRKRRGWTTWGYDTGYKLTQDGVEKVELPVQPAATNPPTPPPS